MYDSTSQNTAELTPEDRILKAYGDKIDYSYHSGYNKITITTRRNQQVYMIMYSVATLAALAIASSWIISELLFSDDPMNGKYAHGALELDPETLIPSLIPSDIFTPLQSILPFPLIILAALATYAFCSVGKYFDRMKEAIDVSYVLFARMLAIVMYSLPVFMFVALMDELMSDGYGMLLYLAEMVIVAMASLSLLLVYYILRLLRKGIHPVPFLKRLLPLLNENARIASAFDAVPFNIRYCARSFGLDRKRLESSMPVLAQLNLDGNCFIITMIAMLYIAINSTPLSLAEAVATIAIIGEVVFGWLLNLTNITGDIVTAATEEVRDFGTADKINEAVK